MSLFMRALFLPLLLAALSAAVPARAVQLRPGDLAFWNAIENSSDPALYRAYLKAYPDGGFAALARIRANLAVPAAGPAAAAAPGTGDLAFWQSIENSADPAEYRAYLETYPNGRFAAIARIRANGGATASATPSGQGADELAFWQSVENSRDPAEFAAYLRAYPEGRFAALARLRMAALGSVPGAAAGESSGAGSATLESETSRASSLRYAEDIASLLDAGGKRSLLTIVGQGASQNLADLYANGTVDMAIVPTDVLDHARAHKLYPGMTDRITYIAKLYNEELHLLARRGINSLAALANQTVDVGVPGGGTEITAARLFRLLKIPVKMVNDPPAIALEKLKRGEIGALALVAPEPAGLFAGLRAAEGPHFLSVPLTPAVTSAFVPTRLTSAEYPGLIAANRPVDTVAVGTALVVAPMTADSARYRAVAQFVDRFFTRFGGLVAPGHDAKWREVNLAADLPGWRRFPPAAQWLERNASVGTMNPQALEVIFSRFIDGHQKATGAAPMQAEEKADLFKEFEKWQHGHLQ